MPEIPTLTTPRLILRPVELADAEQIQRVFPRWEIVEFLSSRIPWPYPPGESLTYIRNVCLPAMEQGKEWHWTIRRKESPEEIIGTINIRFQAETNRGFWLVPEWWGQGLMTEVCAEVVRYWFEILQKPVLRVGKAVANTRSSRITQREGMRLILTRPNHYVSGTKPEEIWEITAEEWRARQTS